MYLQGKNILVGITGGIAAFKTPLLIRLFKKAGCNVKVVATKAAFDFVTEETLSVVSENSVISDFFDEEKTWNHHVDLGLWADLFIVAPLTANTMAKMANGLCDNILMATFLSLRGKAQLYPAMDLDMWTQSATQANVSTLEKQEHISVFQPSSGSLASGLEGKGRMPEPEEIFENAKSLLLEHQHWFGKKVLITAGPTYEAIDPVRFIGNHSSGKMGYAIAEAFIKKGAEVVLVSGPTHLSKPNGLAELISVQTANAMLQACEQHFNSCDVVVFCAAVSDYKVKHQATSKIKREGKTEITLELVSNPDIAKTLSSQKKQQICLGFALETENGIENAKQKRLKKNLDCIVLNTLDKENGVDFGSDHNKVLIIGNNKELDCGFKSKQEIAHDIQETLYHWYFA